MRRALSHPAVRVLLVALAVRVALFACAGPHPERLMAEEDSAEYVQIGRNLADAHGFSQAARAPYDPDLRRTPVYPAVLAAVFQTPGANVRAAAVASIIASTLTVLAVFRIAETLAGTHAASWAALLLAVDLTSAAYSTQVLTEALFTLLLALSYVPLLDRRVSATAGAAASGVLNGLAALCRPIGILSVVAVAPACRLRAGTIRQSTRLFLMAAVMAGALVGAWMLRNYRVSGTGTVSSVVATNMYFHRAAHVAALLEHRRVEDLRDEWQREFRQQSASWSDADRLAWMNQHGRDVVLQHPFAYAVVALRGAARMFAPDSIVLPTLFGGEAARSYRALHAAAWVQLALVYGLAVFGAARLWRVSRLGALVPIAPIAYFLIIGGPEMYPRFRVPLMPFICLLAGAGIAKDTQRR